MPALIDLLITFPKVGYMYMIADDVILGLDQSEIHVTFDIFLYGVAGGDVVNQWDEKQKTKINTQKGPAFVPNFPSTFSTCPTGFLYVVLYVYNENNIQAVNDPLLAAELLFRHRIKTSPSPKCLMEYH